MTVERFELQAYLYRCLCLPSFQRDVLIHAANHLLEPHHHSLLPYTGELLHRADTTPEE